MKWFVSLNYNTFSCVQTTRAAALQFVMHGLLLCSDRSVPSHRSPGLQRFASPGIGFVKPSTFLETQKSVHKHEWSGPNYCLGDVRDNHSSTEEAK